MNRFVLDCSVTMAWCFENEAEPRADDILQGMPDSTAYVPSIWALEVANVLLVGERRGRLTEADSDAFLARLQLMNIEQESTFAPHAVLPLARRYGLSAYDCAYMELAMRLGLPLVTLDSKLRQAADAAGIIVAP